MPGQTSAVTVSRLRLRLPKSETRDLADRELAAMRRAEPEAWRMSNSTFFSAFVAITAALAIAALVLR
jgi:hypothetical protein